MSCYCSTKYIRLLLLLTALLLVGAVAIETPSPKEIDMFQKAVLAHVNHQPLAKKFGIKHKNLKYVDCKKKGFPHIRVSNESVTL